MTSVLVSTTISILCTAPAKRVEQVEVGGRWPQLQGEKHVDAAGLGCNKALVSRTNDSMSQY